MANSRIVILGWADSVHVQRWVTGLAERGYQIRLISPGGAPIAGIDTIILPREGKFTHLRQAATVRGHIEEFKPDLVNAHYASSIGLWAARARFSPTVVSVWGSDITAFGQHWWGRAALRHVFARAQALTATSRFLYDQVGHIASNARRKTTVIPFGVDVPPVRRPLADSATFNIAFLKSHRAIYGPDFLLKAFARAHAKNHSIRLNMAGEGPMTEELKALTKSLGITNAVTFTGWLDRTQIYPFLESQHVLAMPSRMESFGVAALEAAACGRPVVATNVGGVSEIVRDNDTGLLVPSGNIEALAVALLRLADDRQFAQVLGERGYQMVRDEYAWQHSLDLMAQLYDRLIYDKKANPALRH